MDGDAITALLANDPAVTSIVGDRIYYGRIPELEGPSVQVRPSGGRAIKHLRGVSQAEQRSYQFDCYHNSIAEAQVLTYAVLAAVLGSMNAYGTIAPLVAPVDTPGAMARFRFTFAIMAWTLLNQPGGTPSHTEPTIIINAFGAPGTASIPLRPDMYITVEEYVGPPGEALIDFNVSTVLLFTGTEGEPGTGAIALEQDDVTDLQVAISALGGEGDGLVELVPGVAMTIDADGAVGSSVIALAQTQPLTINATGTQGSARVSIDTGVTGSELTDYQRRISLQRITMKTKFDTAAEVFDFIQLTDTYTAHPDWAQHVTAGHPMANLIPPGNIGMMRLVVDWAYGEHDNRNAQPWQSGVAYTVDSPGVTYNGSYYGCRQNHTSGAITPSNGTYWINYGSNGTGYDDPHVTWVRRFDDTWGPLDAFRDGDEYWTLRQYYVPLYYEESVWDRNANSAGGHKFDIESLWCRANPDEGGQMVFGTANFRDYLNSYVRLSNGDYSNMERLLSLAAYSEGNQIVWQNAIAPYVAGGPHWRQENRWPIDHPARLDPNPTGASNRTRARRGTGGVYSWRDLYGTGDWQPFQSDPEHGGVKTRRDIANKLCDFIRHVKIGNIGQPNTVIEEYVGFPDGRMKLINVITDYELPNNTTSFTAGHMNQAYYDDTGAWNPTPLPWGPNAFHILAQATSRIKNTHRHSTDGVNVDGTHDPGGFLVSHIMVREGYQGFTPQGRVLPQESRVVRPEYLPASMVRKQMTSALNGFLTPESCMPPEWRQGNTFPGIAETDGRYVLTFSGLIWHPFLPRCWLHRGGGHAATFHNPTISCNFAGGLPPLIPGQPQAPATFEGFDYEDGSSVYDVRRSIDPNLDGQPPFNTQPNPVYADGRGNSVHTYGAQAIDAYETLWQYGGATHADGDSNFRLIGYKLGSKSGSGYSVYTGHGLVAGYGEGMGYSWRFDRLVLWSADNEDGRASLFDPYNRVWTNTHIWTGHTVDNGGNGPGYVFDHTRDQMYTIGRRQSSNSHVRITITSGSTLTWADITYLDRNGRPTTDPLHIPEDLAFLNADAAAGTYDQWNDRIWVADLSANASGVNPDYGRYLWMINPTNLRCERFEPTGDAVNTTTGDSWSNLPRLGHHRLGMLPYWNAVAFWGRIGDAPYIIGL